MAIHHLAKKAERLIPQYDVRNSIYCSIPFIDEIKKKTRYIHFCNIDNEWRFTGTADEPLSETKQRQEIKKHKGN
ncbi:MAG TPA: hypothetical protein VKT28_20585, partial [Puia sp.]|nr:hypothetical protein [Puia sp.]